MKFSDPAKVVMVALTRRRVGLQVFAGTFIRSANRAKLDSPNKLLESDISDKACWPFLRVSLNGEGVGPGSLTIDNVEELPSGQTDDNLFCPEHTTVSLQLSE